MFGSRPIMAHPTDVFIRNVALVGLLFLSVLYLWDANQTKNDDGEVSCWAPAYFTDIHSEFSNRMCKETDQTYSIDPVPNATIKKITVFRSAPERKHWTHGIIEKMGKNNLVKCLVAEAAVVVVAFTLLRNIAGRASSQARILISASGGSSLQRQMAARLRNSYSTIASYITVELLYFIAMVVMVAQVRKLFPTAWNLETSVRGKAHVFLCDFEVRQMGNRHRHTLQCVGVPPEQDVPSGVPLLVTYADCVLCGILALLVALHTAQLVLLSPASADVMESCGLDGATTLGNRLRFGFSDMNMAASLLPTIDVLQVVVVQGKKTGEDSGLSMTKLDD